MSSPLQNAIDVVVAFVDEYKAARDRWHKTPGNVIVWNARPPETLPRFDVPRFEELSRTVLIEAERLGLGDKLPQPDSSTFNPEATAPAFIGCINLPGYFGIGSGFVPMPTERWRDALLTLRALAWICVIALGAAINSLAGLGACVNRSVNASLPPCDGVS